MFAAVATVVDFSAAKALWSATESAWRKLPSWAAVKEQASSAVPKCRRLFASEVKEKCRPLVASCVAVIATYLYCKDEMAKTSKNKGAECVKKILTYTTKKMRDMTLDR